jgi:hypothetical protein
MTASGQWLGSDPVKALEAWNALPEEERKPGGVDLGARGPVDPKTALAPPPEGGLILRLYYRSLAYRPDRELRAATQDDFPHGQGRVNLDAQPNFLWMTASQVKAMLPTEPKKGDKHPVPASVTELVFRHYLMPIKAFCACSGWGKDGVRGGELNLIVEEVSADSVQLRLDGFAQLGAVYDPERGAALTGPFGYEPRVLGRLSYDPRSQKITRFEFVALGDTFGYPNAQNDLAWRPCWRAGRQPLGVAFEMVPGNSPIERIPPSCLPSSAGE